MKSRWFQLLITIFIIFSYMQFEYVRYCMECDAGYQEYSYVNAVINIVGDRYLILLVSGILIVWSIAGLLAVTRNNFYLKLRIGSEHRANVIEVVYAFKYVKEHKGIDPENKDVSNRADKMVIVANMDVQKYSLFSWEKNVSLIEGEFPTYKNKGIIVEQRYAKKNNLKVGDEVKYTIGDQPEVTSLQICGIYKVDSDFEIYDSNEEGTSVYIHSPYNSIYVDYDYIVELLGLEYTASTGSEVYIDKIEHIDAVKTQLKKMYGDNVEIYDNTSNYLDSECKVVGLMGKTSKIICWMIIIMGGIVLLIIFSFYTIQYQKDTGLFMVLGRSRKWCIGRFAFIGMIYAISGLLLGVLLYCVLGNFICSIISGIGKNVIINSTDRAIGGYDTPGIFQGFEVRIEMSAFFTLKNIIILLIISLVNWIAFMVLPVVTTVEENAKKLLNSKG